MSLGTAIYNSNSGSGLVKRYKDKFCLPYLRLSRFLTCFYTSLNHCPKSIYIARQRSELWIWLNNICFLYSKKSNSDILQFFTTLHVVSWLMTSWTKSSSRRLHRLFTQRILNGLCFNLTIYFYFIETSVRLYLRISLDIIRTFYRYVTILFEKYSFRLSNVLRIRF